MHRTNLFTIAATGLLIAACDSGDINIQPSTVVENSNNTTNTNTGGSADDICASFVKITCQR